MSIKRWLSVVIALITLFCFSACGKDDTQKDTENNTTSLNTISTAEPENGGKPVESEKKTLILYFSCTGTTKNAAEEIQRQTGADILEIVPSVPYTAADLNYSGDCRANREQNDISSRPETATVIEDFAAYDTIIIGFPIWWGTMPKIINTVLDTYDFSGKTIVPFCTSGGSGISAAVSAIKSAEPNADVREGLRVGKLSQIAEWLENIDLT